MNEIQLDDKYTVGYDDSNWLHLLILDGPRLNFNSASIYLLGYFLNDTSQIRSIISEMYYIERKPEGEIILHVAANASYQFTPEVAEQLRCILNKITNEPEDYA